MNGSSIEQHLLELIEAHPGNMPADLFKISDLVSDQQQVYQALHRLRTKKLVRVDGRRYFHAGKTGEPVNGRSLGWGDDEPSAPSEPADRSAPADTKAKQPEAAAPSESAAADRPPTSEEFDEWLDALLDAAEDPRYDPALNQLAKRVRERRS